MPKKEEVSRKDAAELADVLQDAIRKLEKNSNLRRDPVVKALLASIAPSKGPTPYETIGILRAGGNLCPSNEEGSKVKATPAGKKKTEKVKPEKKPKKRGFDRVIDALNLMAPQTVGPIIKKIDGLRSDPDRVVKIESKEGEKSERKVRQMSDFDLLFAGDPAMLETASKWETWPEVLNHVFKEDAIWKGKVNDLITAKKTSLEIRTALKEERWFKVGKSPTLKLASF
jgi:hypothetical protein